MKTVYELYVKIEDNDFVLMGTFDIKEHAISYVNLHFKDHEYKIKRKKIPTW
jgi:hypothetical protein